MPNPVVHFEILGKDGAKLQSFYRDLFGWKIDANNPWNYGTVDNGGEGINGGIGPAEDGSTRVTIYAQVADPQDVLDRVVSMGGKVVMPVTEIPNMVTMALFADPEGNVVGLVKG